MEQFFPRRLIISIESGGTDNLFTVLQSHQNLLLMHEMSELQQLSSSESSGSIKTLQFCPSTQTDTIILFPFHSSAILKMTSGKMQRRCQQRFKALLKYRLSSEDPPTPENRLRNLFECQYTSRLSLWKWISISVSLHFCLQYSGWTKFKLNTYFNFVFPCIIV